MIRSSLPITTHTLEMVQVDELNERLASHGSAVTATTIGMGGARLHPVGASGLPDDAVLVRVSWRGSPEFPDVYGHFGPGQVEALLHTAALHRVSQQLGLRQSWGVGPAAAKD